MSTEKSPGLSTADAKSQYLDLFQREFPTTLKVMKAYPAGKGSFQPHERSASALRLVHAFSVENMAVLAALRGQWKIPPSFPPPPATYLEAVDSYERGARELIAAVEATPDSKLLESIPFFTGPKQMGDRRILDVMWLMLLDSIHHRGQLSVYVRMAGGKVPSIYGPSADEPWM
jgi:uncharacterized damage-inducible protein DinB